MTNFYKNIFRPILFRISPDNAHRLASFSLKSAGYIPGSEWMIRKSLSYSHPALASTVSGIQFPNPVGLPGGFDPNGSQAPIYNAMGFGFATIGSVTSKAQIGNPRPHFTRLKKDESLLVNKGLMNKGAEHIGNLIGKLRAAKKINYPLGISIARTTDIPKASTGEDYAESYRLLAPHADYIEVNVSCPNVAGFKPEEQTEYIREILTKISQCRNTAQGSTAPVWLKVGPDISDDWNEKIIQLCLEYKVDAIVLTNLLKDRSGLRITSQGWQNKPGSISGRLLAPFSEAKLRFFYERLKGKIPIISVGGIFTADDVYRRIRMGASLVQMLTGWIYEGPGITGKISRELVSLLHNDRFKNINEAIGTISH